MEEEVLAQEDGIVVSGIFAEGKQFLFLGPRGPHGIPSLVR